MSDIATDDRVAEAMALKKFLQSTDFHIERLEINGHRYMGLISHERAARYHKAVGDLRALITEIEAEGLKP